MRVVVAGVGVVAGVVAVAVAVVVGVVVAGEVAVRNHAVNGRVIRDARNL